MEYFKINGHDYSKYVYNLGVETQHIYNGGTKTNGQDWAVLKYTRVVLTVGIIPLDEDIMAQLQEDLAKFSVNVSYRDPKTNALKENVKCIIPVYHTDYYNLAGRGKMYKGFLFTVKQL